MKVNSMLYIFSILNASFNFPVSIAFVCTAIPPPLPPSQPHTRNFIFCNSHRRRMRERKKKAGDNGQTYETTFGKISNLFRRGLCMFYVLCTSCISHIHVYPSIEYAFYICTKSKPNFVCYILFMSLLKLP